MVKYVLLYFLTGLLAVEIQQAYGQQDTNVVSLSPLVGKAITKAERRHYRVMAQEGYLQADSLRFLQAPNGKLFLEINLPYSKPDRPSRLLIEYQMDRFLSVKQGLESGSVLLKSLTKAVIDTLPKRTVVRTWDGQVVAGKGLSLTDQRFLLLTSFGLLDLPIESISSVTVYEVSPNSEDDRFVYHPNPSPTRYLFGPSAIPLRGGEGYYQNVLATVHSGYVGIGNHFSIGGGFETISLFTGNPVGFLAPRVGFKVSDRLYTGVGAIGAAGPGFTLGGLFANVTAGSNEKNVTATAGFIRSEWQSFGVITLNGFSRTSRRVGLVTENWFVFSEGELIPVLSGGVRLIGEKFAVDLALVVNPELVSQGVVALPFAGVVFKF